MKRLIKYWNRYENDKHAFSACSTIYELLPEIVADDAGNDVLRELAAKHGVKIQGRAISIEANPNRYGRAALHITNAYKTPETKVIRSFRDDQKAQVYIGFINIPSGCLEPVASLDTPLTKDQALEIVNCRDYGVDDIGTMTDETSAIIVMGGWEYYHALRVAGYSLESFREAFDASEDSESFYDSVFRCSDCGLYDYNDSGYTYNYRIVDCEQLGLNCGCYEARMESPRALEGYADDDSKAIERSAMLKHEEAGRVKHLECFIGGMTDGRGGYFQGYGATREGNPETVLKEYQERFPRKRFVFSHDESGQFQTYFSIWEILEKKPKAKKAKTKSQEL